jgi:proline dehydrogenase
MGVKLVRGAYMQQERQYAKDNGLLDPIHDNASATHNAYDTAAKFLHKLETPLVLATHNWDSIQAAMNNPKAGFAQLYGMGDWMTIEIARRGIASYKYVPFGSVQETVNHTLESQRFNVLNKIGTISSSKSPREQQCSGGCRQRPGLPP